MTARIHDLTEQFSFLLALTENGFHYQVHREAGVLMIQRRATHSLPLDHLPVGQHARVTAIRGDGAVRQRLLDLGLLPGRIVRLIRVAPATGPLWLGLDGSQLSLRRSEASRVEVTPLS